MDQPDCCLRVLSRGLQRLGKVKSIDDSLPFDFGLLKIDQKTKGAAGGSQVVDALRSVLIGEALDTLELDYQRLFNEDIGEVFSNVLAFVKYGNWRLKVSPDVTKAEFSEQSALVHLLEEAGAPSVLATSNTAPSTRSVSESRDVR